MEPVFGNDLTTNPIPKVVKKWAIRLLLWAMKGLVGLKKVLVFLIFSVIRRPARVLWSGILFPILTFIYSVYRRVRKVASLLYEPARGAFRHLLTGRHIVPVTILTVVLLVSGNNIYANEFSSEPDLAEDGGILAETTLLHNEEDVVVEEAAEEITADEEQDISYLGTHALSMRDYYPTDEELQSYSGTDDGMFDDSAESHIINAVRPEPGGEGASANLGPTRTKIVEYVVEDGDSLGTIARKFALNTTTILWENNLNSWSVIRPGQTLRILPDDGVSYKVKSGDTVARIAAKYGIPAATIMDANGIVESVGLQVGDMLVLPGAKPPAPLPPKYVPPPTTYVPPASSEVVGDSDMVWPAGVRRITQYWGPRHTGVDIAGPMRTPIYAATDGTVTFSGWNTGGYGNMIIIDHGNGLHTRYAHATRNLVSVGDTVTRGQVIALMGSTGRSTGPHLHFEVMKGTIYARVNPLKYVK